MDKRTKKAIEKDVAAIKEAAKTASTLKELAESIGLSVQKVRTSLDHHPIIKKRVMSMLDANKSKSKEISAPTTSVKKSTSLSLLPPSEEKPNSIVICDCPALMYGLSNCLESPIVIPNFVRNSLIGLSKNNDADGFLANKAIVKINTVQNWCTIAPKINEQLLVEPSFEVSWRARALVALACKYWAEGYQVTIKTRTREVTNLAKLQECLKVSFVPADDKTELKVVS